MKDDNFTLLDAKVARETTNDYIKLKDEEQLKRIDEQICAAIKRGKYSFYLEEPLAPNNRKILKEYGYTIYDEPSEEENWLYCGRPFKSITISWR